MVRIHDGKIGRGAYARAKASKMTTDNHAYSMIYKHLKKVSYAMVKCPVCSQMNKVPVKDEKTKQFRCVCGQMLQFRCACGQRLRFRCAGESKSSNVPEGSQ